MLTIRVPATSANLGPGFDCAGIALGLYATFQFQRNTSLIISGCEPEFANESNLVYQSYAHILQYYQKPVQPFLLHIQSDIPLARGLGSSAACIVAGIMAANFFYNLELSKEIILFHATSLEGHPDNVAPAIYGGFVLSMVDDNQPYSVSCPIHPAYQFYANIPDFTLSTAKARAVLPKQVSFHDAVHNIARTALTLKALELNDAELLAKAMQDVLHEPYRSQLIPEFAKIKQLAKIHGCITSVLSGAGPTVLHIAANPIATKEWQAAMSQLSHHWRLISLPINTSGATICKEESYE